MTNDPHPRNRRHFTRIQVDNLATLYDAQQQWQGQLLDISLKGALLHAPQLPEAPLQGLCRLTIQLHAQDVCITMVGQVVHTEGEHVGFRCDSIDLESITHLKRLVELNLGDEMLLERELGELIRYQP